jgi:excisionase family DNA binding protein
MAEDWLTTYEAAKLSGYHLNHVRRLIRSGQVKGRKFLTVWQVSRQSLLAYLKRQDQQGERRGRKKSV